MTGNAHPLTATAAGDGYWLVASDGGVFNFGGAPFAGSTGGQALHSPIVGMAPTATGVGYWLAPTTAGAGAESVPTAPISNPC